MEIVGGGRLEVLISPADVGKRVSVRQVVPDGPPGAKFTDAVGVLTSWNDGVLLITRKSGDRVRIVESALVAGRTVPSAPARRRGPAATYEELARVSARAWQPLETGRLGDWELRAAVEVPGTARPIGPAAGRPAGAPAADGPRTGFTRRANSVLPLGDPGVPLEEALTRVREWYAARGLPPYVQTATGGAGTQEMLCAELEARGWVREVSALLRVGGLAPIGDLDAEAAGRVVLSRTVDDSWLRRYQRKGASEVAVKVLGAGPSVWFATIPGGPGSDAPAAIGRCVVDGRWAGFMAVEVGPEHRRRGLALGVMAALARTALDEGASAAWLQVETDNAPALALYDRLGFSTHHSYHHYRGV